MRVETIAGNHAVHLRTACAVLQIENQLSVPGDGRRSPTEIMSVNRRYFFLVLAAWLALAVLSVATQTPAIAFLNYSNRNDYGCCEPVVAGDTWLRVCGKSSSSGFTLPLIYSFETSGPPITLTVSALDYRKDSIDYIRMDVKSVFVTVDGISTQLTVPQNKQQVEFSAHYSGAMANCILRMPDNLQPITGKEIFVTASVVVSTGTRTDHYTISGVLGQSHWSGHWLIFEAFTPHA